MKTNSYSFATMLLAIAITISSCKEEQAMQAPPAEVEVIEVIQKEIPIYREFVGQVYGLKDIPIRARVEGFLTGIYFSEGRQVKEGQLLYSIDAQPFEAEVASQQSKVAEAQTYLVNATNELARYEPLAKINAVSKSDLDAAIATKDAAEASLEAAKANLEMAQIQLGYTQIYSPINGLIGNTDARIGEFVGREPNPVILNTVSQIEQTRVQFFLTEREFLGLIREYNLRERELEQYKQGERNREEVKPENTDNLELILADGSMYSEKGNVEFLGREVDASTGSILVQAIFPNPNGELRPGMFAKVRVKFETVSNAILVPQRCVTELQGQFSVYVVEEGNVVKPRQVEVGDKIGDLWYVREGLTSSDKVIVTGLQKVASGVTVNPTVVEFQSITEGE